MQLRAFTIALATAGDRRMRAAGLALLIHGALALAVLFLPPSRLHTRSQITEIVLIPPPVEAAPVADIEPDVADEALTDTSAEDDPADMASETDQVLTAAPAELPAVSAQAAPADSGAMSDSADAYPLSPGTRSVLQGLQCPGDPEAFARTGLCPQGARRGSRMVAADPSASDFFDIDAAAIRARFGIAPHALAGQATLDAGQRRSALSNSDSIRDALPASQPDPAFGD